MQQEQHKHRQGGKIQLDRRTRGGILLTHHRGDRGKRARSESLLRLRLATHLQTRTRALDSRGNSSYILHAAGLSGTRLRLKMLGLKNMKANVLKSMKTADHDILVTMHENEKVKYVRGWRWDKEDSVRSIEAAEAMSWVSGSGENLQLQLDPQYLTSIRECLKNANKNQDGRSSRFLQNLVSADAPHMLWCGGIGELSRDCKPRVNTGCRKVVPRKQGQVPRNLRRAEHSGV